MRVLVADDDDIICIMLEGALRRWGHEVQLASSGEAAWTALSGTPAPQLAVLDWLMPDLEGVEVCRRARANPALNGLYIIMLTARDATSDVVEGLGAGANDYVTKPFHMVEMEARVAVAARVLGLRAELEGRVRELESALARVQTLEGILPICSYCRRVRSDDLYWKSVEDYLASRADTRLSHSICPDCYEREVLPQMEAIRAMPPKRPRDK